LQKKLITRLALKKGIATKDWAQEHSWFIKRQPNWDRTDMSYMLERSIALDKTGAEKRMHSYKANKERLSIDLHLWENKIMS
jgi:hypothetical protein